MDVDQQLRTLFVVIDCKIINGTSGTSSVIFRPLSDCSVHRIAATTFEPSSSRLPHRFPLSYTVPHKTPAPQQTTSLCDAVSADSLYYKLLKVHTGIDCVTLIDCNLQFKTMRHCELDFARDCVCDVLFLDDNTTINWFCDWKSRVGDDLAWTVAPCVCNADAFLMNANLDRDDDGQPLFYRPPVHMPRFMHSNEAVILRPWLQELARHRIQWIRERNLLGYALELVTCTGLSLREVLNSGATAFADAIIELTWMRNHTTVPLPVRSVDASSAATVLLEGGTVLAAQKGCHRGTIVMLDASSLYPSVVLEYSLDPLLCVVFQTLIQARLAATNKIRNRALKLLSNSIFGSRLFGLYKNPQLAANITARGREVLERARWLVSEYNGGCCAIIAGDTDGLAVKCSSADDADALLQLLNTQWRHVKFKIDRRLSVLVQLTKKTWFGCDEHTGARVSKGTEDVKSGTCAYAKRIHLLWQHAILCQDDVDLVSFLEGVRAEIATVDLSELVCHPKPTKTHKNIDRAFVYCSTLNGTGRHTTEEVPVSRFLDLSDPTACYTLDVEKLFKIQIFDPIMRYYEEIKTTL